MNILQDESGKISSKRLMAFAAFAVALGFSIADLYTTKNLIDQTVTWLIASAGYAGITGFQSAFKQK